MSDTPKQPEPHTDETQSVKKPEETKSTPPQKPKNHGASVFTYLAILFAAAFLMLLLAYFIQQRNNDVALDHLRDSITSYQSLDQLIEENQALDDENQRLTQELETARADSEQWQALYEGLDADYQAASAQAGTAEALLSLSIAYQGGDCETCAGILQTLAGSADYAAPTDENVRSWLQGVCETLTEDGYLQPETVSALLP